MAVNFGFGPGLNAESSRGRNNAVPTTAPTAGYVQITNLKFGASNPNAIGVATQIPVNTKGNTSLGTFSKVSSATRKAWSKLVINAQQQRF
jgi:hypothetical protein